MGKLLHTQSDKSRYETETGVWREDRGIHLYNQSITRQFLERICTESTDGDILLHQFNKDALEEIAIKDIKDILGQNKNRN